MCDYINNPTEGDCVMRTIFNITAFQNKKIIYSNFLVVAFIVETTEPTFSVKIDSDLLVLQKTKQFGKFGLFRLSPTLHNYDYYVNFGRINIAKIIKEYNIFIVNINGMSFKGHMGALHYA